MSGGSGKTVSLAEIADHYSSNDQWIVLRLSADTDLIAGAVSELTRISQFHDLDLGLNLNLGIAELSVNKTNDSLEKEAMLRNILEKLKNKGKKVLFIIDEIINNSYVKVFASNFQIYITQNYPVYLVMAGLFDNISNLQNEKSLTFFISCSENFFWNHLAFLQLLQAIVLYLTFLQVRLLRWQNLQRDILLLFRFLVI